MPLLRRSLVPLAAAAALSFAVPALGQAVSVENAWARGTVPGQKATAAYMQLTSPADTALVGVSSPLSGIVEIHQMKLDGTTMTMSAVDRVPLPAGKLVELRPGGYHVMLLDLARPLKQGEVLPLRLTFRDASGKTRTQDVRVPVVAVTAGAKPPM